MKIRIKKDILEKVKSGELQKESEEVKNKALEEYIMSIADYVFTQKDCEEDP